MGSLMAGWDSPSKSIRLDRNKSMTKEEIASYWKSKSKDDQDQDQNKIYRRSISLPIKKEEDEERVLEKHGWWMNSRWAFLNEPPVIASETPFRYAAQFHVARKHMDDASPLHPF